MKSNPLIFLCHASEDKAIVEKLYDNLTEKNYHPWLDQKDILPGQDWNAEIKKAMKKAAFTLVCLSDQSVRKRGYVNKEIKWAIDRQDEMLTEDIFIIPVKLNPCELPDCLENIQWVDLFHKNGFQRLTQAIDYQLKRIKSEFVSDVPDNPGNPFFYGGAVPSSLFYGRKDVLSAIEGCITGKTLQSFSIVGERRMGKSSVLAYVRDCMIPQQPNINNYIVVYLDLSRPACHTKNGLMRTLRKKITRAWQSPWPPDEDGEFEDFDDFLEDLQAANKRFIMLMDEIEHIAKYPHEFDQLLEDFRANGQHGLFSMITASRIPLADICSDNELTSPFFNIFRQRYLPLISKEEWTSLVSDHMDVNTDEINWIYQMAGGHPFFTQMAAYYLWDMKQEPEVNLNVLTQKVSIEFCSHFKYIWEKCTQNEQDALAYYLGRSEKTPLLHVQNSLRQKGLILQENIFSEAFQEYIISFGIEVNQ